MLFINENENHVINLKFDKKLSYEFFYALSRKKILSFIKLFIEESCVKSHL